MERRADYSVSLRAEQYTWRAPLSGLSRNRASVRSTSIIGAPNAQGWDASRPGIAREYAEHTVLHQVIAEHLEPFLRAVAEAGDGAGLESRRSIRVICFERRRMSFMLPVSAG